MSDDDDSEERIRQKTVITVISRISERPPTKEACFVVIYGADLGKKHPLLAELTVIGRSARSDIQIDQESVSRSHAKVVVAGPNLILRDLGSTNGTYVNDELIDEYVLRDGDLIKLGRTIFKFLSGSNIENAYHEEIYRLTTVDGLTQAFNRRYFSEAVERELSRAHRYRRDLSLVLFDIDHFKLINDNLGHLAGDMVLKQVAAALRAKVRREDIFARVGGEEFAFLLPEIDHANAIRFAEKVRKLVERCPIKFDQQRVVVTISLGVATATSETANAEELMRKADERLYVAKQGGRNRVEGQES